MLFGCVVARYKSIGASVRSDSSALQFDKFALYKHENPVQRHKGSPGPQQTLFLLKKMFKICQSGTSVREIALNSMAACSHYIMCKPKGTDDAGF